LAGLQGFRLAGYGTVGEVIFSNEAAQPWLTSLGMENLENLCDAGVENGPLTKNDHGPCISSLADAKADRAKSSYTTEHCLAAL
jgi:hypothetical protein